MGHKGARRNGKGRRAYLTKLSAGYIKGHPGVDNHRMREVTSHRPLNWKDIAFLRLFGLGGTSETDQRGRFLSGAPARFSKDPTPRDLVLKQLATLMNVVDPMKNICLIPNQMMMFWDHNNNYIAVKVDIARGIVKRSYRYSDRASLMFAFENNCIKWKEEPGLAAAQDPRPSSG